MTKESFDGIELATNENAISLNRSAEFNGCSQGLEA
jgi:hypothetical protein